MNKTLSFKREQNERAPRSKDLLNNYFYNLGSGKLYSRPNKVFSNHFIVHMYKYYMMHCMGRHL